jgi:hypothetical protein
MRMTTGQNRKTLFFVPAGDVVPDVEVNRHSSFLYRRSYQIVFLPSFARNPDCDF